MTGRGWRYLYVGPSAKALQKEREKLHQMTNIRGRLTQHLRRRSQRPFRPPEGVSYYEQLQRFGLVRL